MINLLKTYSSSHTTDKKSVWIVDADKVFLDLKKAFTFPPILAHVDPQKPFIIEVAAYDIALGNILSQQGEDGKLHLVAFHSYKFGIVEVDYEVHEKELLVIVDSFLSPSSNCIQ